MTDILVTMGPDGANINYIGGDAERDNGVVNRANFAQLTKKNHWSEDFETSPEAKYKGQYLDATKGLTITRDNLIKVSRAAESDLAGPPFGEIQSETTNPISQQVKTESFIKPVNGNAFILAQTTNGENYINQVTDQ